MSNFNWNYNPSDYKENNFRLLSEGDYRVRIINAVTTVSKTGTEGLEITFEVNGEYTNLKHYIWFNRDNVQYTNQCLGQFFNSFGIEESEQYICDSWIGKTGAVHVIHSDYKGKRIAKVAFCISRERQNNLPPWRNHDSAVSLKNKEGIRENGYNGMTNKSSEFGSMPGMPNEYKPPVRPTREMNFDGFSF